MASNNTYDLGRPLRALDAWDCRLSAPATASSDGKEPFLYLDFRYHLDGKVRDIELSVNLRKPGRDGKIQFFPSMTQFKLICTAIEDAALDRIPDNILKLEAMTTFMFGKRLDRPEAEVMIVVGKDDEGVYIGFSQKGRDNVKFYFTPPKMTQLRLRSGEVLTNGYVSALCARARAQIWWTHIEHMLTHHYMSDAELERAKEEKKNANQKRFAQRQGGGQGGGGNWGGNNNSGGGGGNWNNSNNQASAPAAAAPAEGGFDNDIPW